MEPGLSSEACLFRTRSDRAGKRLGDHHDRSFYILDSNSIHEFAQPQHSLEQLHLRATCNMMVTDFPNGLSQC